MWCWRVWCGGSINCVGEYGAVEDICCWRLWCCGRYMVLDSMVLREIYGPKWCELTAKYTVT
jgi:hypothetical protein